MAGETLQHPGKSLINQSKTNIGNVVKNKDCMTIHPPFLGFQVSPPSTQTRRICKTEYRWRTVSICSCHLGRFCKVCIANDVASPIERFIFSIDGFDHIGHHHSWQLSKVVNVHRNFTHSRASTNLDSLLRARRESMTLLSAALQNGQYA